MKIRDYEKLDQLRAQHQQYEQAAQQCFDEMMRMLIEAGVTVRQAAELTGVSKSTVGREFRRLKEGGSQ